MQPTSAERPPSGAQWRFEPKWDGFRTLLYSEGGRTRLVSRNGLDMTATFPELADLHAALSGDLVVDGEVVAIGPSGRIEFQAVQNRLRGEQGGVLSFIAFDLLHAGDRSVVDLSWQIRREMLERLTRPGGRFAWSPIFPDGATLLHNALRLGLEGIVAKRLDSTYRPGTRTRDWVKVRIRHHAEAIIAGWQEGGSAHGFGSLILAMHRPDGRLVYVGNVGSGFPTTTIADLLARLRPLERPAPSFAIAPGMSHRGRHRGSATHWVTPRLVCEVEFAEWTRDGNLRQPVYRGLRPDKAPAECVTPNHY